MKRPRSDTMCAVSTKLGITDVMEDKHKRHRNTLTTCLLAGESVFDNSATAPSLSQQYGILYDLLNPLEVQHADSEGRVVRDLFKHDYKRSISEQAASAAAEANVRAHDAVTLLQTGNLTIHTHEHVSTGLVMNKQPENVKWGSVQHLLSVSRTYRFVGNTPNFERHHMIACRRLLGRKYGLQEVSNRD